MLTYYSSSEYTNMNLFAVPLIIQLIKINTAETISFIKTIQMHSRFLCLKQSTHSTFNDPASQWKPS